MSPLLRWCLCIAFSIGLIGASVTDTSAQEKILNKPKTPGQFVLHQRTRTESAKGSGEWKEGGKEVVWNASETVIIICDMWDGHYCVSASERVADMVPRMNAVLTAARNHGATVIHAPSGVTYHYADMPQRKRMQQATKFKPEIPLEAWCYVDPKREPELPVDVSKQPCDDPVVGPAVRVFNRQHAGIDIIGFDGISDRGDEIYSFCQTHGIKNIALTGVHTNMCVLGRPFGIRQLVKLGFHVVLVRDLTDAMYDPRQPPFVSHTRGTQLVIEHIEKYWCPSIASDDLRQVIPGSDDPVTK